MALKNQADNGFKQLKSEQCIFKKMENGKLKCIIGLYVDDMVIAGKDSEIINITNTIRKGFKISKSEPIIF